VTGLESSINGVKAQLRLWAYPSLLMWNEDAMDGVTAECLGFALLGHLVGCHLCRTMFVAKLGSQLSVEGVEKRFC